MRRWLILLFLCLSTALTAQSPQTIRIRMALPGSAPSSALRAFDAGPLAAEAPLEKILMLLSITPEQQQALDRLTSAQQDPASSEYHRWLTPAEYGARFGASSARIAEVTAWLEREGLQVNEISASHRSILFSGSAAALERAFATRMHRYVFNGEEHIASTTALTVPVNLNGAVAGVVSLNGLRARPLHTRPTPATLIAGNSALAPADFRAIYDVNPVWNEGYSGDGQSIAVISRSNIHPADIEQFRASFDLPPRAPQVIVNGPDPGTSDAADLEEATLDTEWAGAIARDATIQLVATQSTAATDGTYLSAEYAVDHNLAPIVSFSYGLCETSLGTAGNAFLNALWQQAAVQGITVLVAAADSGAAACDTPSERIAKQGRSVNGICSTPYDLCVGGTQFTGTADSLGYIPEAAWNASSGGGLWSTGGGRSAVYSKPPWQSGPGVPADHMRDVPDVALNAAAQDGYLIYLNGSLRILSGTSAATPAFAGIVALAAQVANTRFGAINPMLYQLAALPENSGAQLFHDIVDGDNSVPGVPGFSAGAGYDPATGLGSVDTAHLIAALSAKPAAQAAFNLQLGASQIQLAPGRAATVSVRAALPTDVEPLSLTVGNSSPNLRAYVHPDQITATSSSASLSIYTEPDTPPGSYPLTITATSGSEQHQITLTVTVPAGRVLPCNWYERKLPAYCNPQNF
ncbi:MAG: S8/S53 family peptidase [Acidobacteria bacterium]|nr:S8/S53 family peptidase [Acidobacteriota bacterium]